MKYRSSVARAALLLSATFLAPMAALAGDELYHGPGAHAQPDGRGNRVVGSPRRNTSGGAVVTGNGIDYNGGPVMHDTVKIYFIWYGDWSQDPNAAGILNTWASTIGGTPYLNINTTYGDATGNVSGSVQFGGSTISTSSFGNLLSDSNIASIVSNALTSHALPTDTNGVYFVLTAPGVGESSGFLSQYCGWHTYGTLGGANIKYAFVGDAGNHSGCSVQFSKSPNNDPPVDAMISVMSHELEEAITDPNLNAWYSNQTGEENADMCAWNFGAESTAPNGSQYNMSFGGRNYLIQQNWLNANGGGCALSYTATPDFSLSVSPTSQTLSSSGGTTGNYTITAIPLGGFTGTPSYSITGLPAGVSSSAISSTGTFTLTAVSGLVAKSYPFTITGTSISPSLTHSITASLVVNPPPQPSFTISISPSSQSVSRGGKAIYTVTIAPVNGFTGTVALTPGGAKTGVNPTLDPTSVGPNGISTLTVLTSPSAKKGNNTLTVTGTYTGTGGTITKSASVSLRIN